MSPLITATDVYKTFGTGRQKIAALNGVELTVCAGEFVAIVGKSGSGKSTLLYSLAGLIPVNSGNVTLAGHDITRAKKAELAKIRRDHTSFIFQDLNLISSLSVAENVELPARLAGTKPGRDVVARALEDVGLADKARAYPSNLSGGQQQRVAIARSLVRSPRVLFADEPTGSLDAATGDVVLDLLRSTVTDASTLVMVTHDLDLAATADRVIVLARGRTETVLQRPTPAELFHVLH